MTQIFDRGNKKWVSIMMPELRDGLRKVFADPPPERPELDEQRMEEINLLLTQAWKTGRQVVIRIGKMIGIMRLLVKSYGSRWGRYGLCVKVGKYISR